MSILSAVQLWEDRYDIYGWNANTYVYEEWLGTRDVRHNSMTAI